MPRPTTSGPSGGGGATAEGECLEELAEAAAWLGVYGAAEEALEYYRGATALLEVPEPEAGSWEVRAEVHGMAAVASAGPRVAMCRRPCVRVALYDHSDGHPASIEVVERGPSGYYEAGVPWLYEEARYTVERVGASAGWLFEVSEALRREGRPRAAEAVRSLAEALGAAVAVFRSEQALDRAAERIAEAAAYARAEDTEWPLAGDCANAEGVKEWRKEKATLLLKLAIRIRAASEAVKASGHPVVVKPKKH